MQVFEGLGTVGIGNKLVPMSIFRIERGASIHVRASRHGYFTADVQHGMRSVYITISVDIFSAMKTIKERDWISLKDGRIADVISKGVSSTGEDYINIIRIRPLVQEPNLMDVYSGKEEPIGIDDISSLFIQMGRFPPRK